MDIKDKDLVYRLVPRESLGFPDLNRLFELMDANYYEMAYDRFLEDLNQKQWVGLILDSEEVIQGFTTFAINPKGCGTAEYNIIFSGDTIMNPVHWGSQVLMKGWTFTIGQLIATHPEKDWYWYLMSKGHRTYMYLPLFFMEYYPSVDAPQIPENLWRIANEVSEILYPKYWQKDKGVIHFPENRGSLASELAQATYKKARSKYVAFFLEKNPGFHQGDELVCIAPLRINNFVRTSKEFVTWGYQHPLVSP